MKLKPNRAIKMKQQECSDLKNKMNLYGKESDRQQGESVNKAGDVAFTTLRHGVSGNKHNFYRTSFIGLFFRNSCFWDADVSASVSIVRGFYEQTDKETFRERRRETYAG